MNPVFKPNLISFSPLICHSFSLVSSLISRRRFTMGRGREELLEDVNHGRNPIAWNRLGRAGWSDVDESITREKFAILYYAHHRPAIFWTWWLSSIRGADTGAYIIEALFRRSQGDALLSSLFPDAPTALIKKNMGSCEVPVAPIQMSNCRYFLEFLEILRIMSSRLSRF